MTYRWAWNRDDRLLRQVLHHFQRLVVVVDHIPHEHVANHANDAQADRCKCHNQLFIHKSIDGKRSLHLLYTLKKRGNCSEK